MTNRRLTLGTLTILGVLAVLGVMTGCPEAGVAPSPTPLPSVKASIPAGEIANAFGIGSYDVDFAEDADGKIAVNDVDGASLGTIVMTQFPDGSTRADLVGSNGVLASLHIAMIHLNNPRATQITRTLTADGLSLKMYDRIIDDRLLDPAYAEIPVSDHVLSTLLPPGAVSPALGDVIYTNQGPVARLVVIEDDQTLASEDEVNAWIDEVGLTPLLTNRAAEVLMGTFSDLDLGMAVDNELTDAGLLESSLAHMDELQLSPASAKHLRACASRDFWGAVTAIKAGVCLGALALSPTGWGAVAAAVACVCAAVVAVIFIVHAVRCSYWKGRALTTDDCAASRCVEPGTESEVQSCTADFSTTCRRQSGETSEFVNSCTSEFDPDTGEKTTSCYQGVLAPGLEPALSADQHSCPCECDAALCASYCTNLAFEVGSSAALVYCGDTGCLNDLCACIFASCGDGILTRTCPNDPSFNEECDDGNTANGDGCDQHCKWECGNAVLNLNEECEDGNRTNGDGCDEHCRLEAVCGDGLVDSTEECDDGNTFTGDGCNGECEEQNGWRCLGEPSRCRTICGDGLIRGNEQCDPPDVECCSNTCRIPAECL